MGPILLDPVVPDLAHAPPEAQAPAGTLPSAAVRNANLIYETSVAFCGCIHGAKSIQ